MTKNFAPDNTPTSFSDCIGKICKNVALAAILSIIVYISVLYIYRTVGSPDYAGYSTTTYTTDENGTENEKITTYFFADGEEHVVPESDDTHKYSPIYSNDIFPEVFTEILTVILYVLMLYSVVWAFGVHQRNFEQCAGREKTKFVGLKLGVCSSFMFGLAYILSVFAKLGLPVNFAFPLFGLVNAPFLPLFNAFIQGGPQGVVGIAGLINNSVADFSPYGFVAMLAPLMLKIGVCIVAYELGYKQISVKEKILFKNK